MSATVLTILEATVSLYPANEAGQPITTLPVWIGACVEKIEMRAPWKVATTFPTGRDFPKKHPLFQEHTLTLERIQFTPLPGMQSFLPTNGRFVLEILWSEEGNSLRWKKRTYFGVTISADDFESQSLDSTAGHMIEKQVFDAEYYGEQSGTGTPPATVLTNALYVNWVGNDATLRLYEYDTTTQLFTESSAGITTNRATLAYTGGFAGLFEVNFTGFSPARWRCFTQFARVNLAYREQVPPVSAVPRVEFWINRRRVASVSASGYFWANTIREETPVSSPLTQFEIYSQSVITAAISGPKTALKNIAVGT